MASDSFLQISGIKGESTDDAHKDWIEVLSFGWGVTQATSATKSSSGGGTTQRADFADLHIVKEMDSATPKIMQACAEGKHFDEVILELCRAGGDKLKYMELKMENVVISSASINGGGEGSLPTETVTFNYGKIQETYTKQARKGGGGSGNVAAGWDLEANKSI